MSFSAITKVNKLNLFDIPTHIIQMITNHIKQIPSNHIDKLIEGVDRYDLITSDSKPIILTFLGKGDEGTVYAYDKLVAVKFFVNSTNNEINFLTELKKLYKEGVMIQTLIMYDYFIVNNHLVLLSNRADGNIDKWMKELKSSDIDTEWYHMMLQIVYGVMIIQKKLFTYHKDLLHRNILYKVLDKPIRIKYLIIYEGKKTVVIFQTQTIFFITDFGKSQSLLFDSSNIMSEKEIINNIESNKDLEGLASIYNKLFVDYIYHNINHKKLYQMIEGDMDAAKYLEEIENKMKEKAKKIPKPSNYIKLQVTRGLCYYLIENNYINIDKYKSKINASIPSKKVRKILENLADYRPIYKKIRIIRKKLKNILS